MQQDGREKKTGNLLWSTSLTIILLEKLSVQLHLPLTENINVNCGNCHTSIFCPLLYAVPLCKLSNNSFFQPQRLPATKLICTKQIFWSSLLTNLSRTDIDFHKKSSLWQTLTLFAHLYWGGRVGGGVWGRFKTKQKQGAKPFIHPALSILACVFVGGKGSAGWENVKNM